MLFYLLILTLLNLVFSFEIKSKTITNSDNLNIVVKYSIPKFLEYYSYPLLFIHGSNSGSWVFEEKWFKYFNNLGWKTYGINLRGSYETGNTNNQTLKLTDLVDDLSLVLSNFKSLEVDDDIILNRKPIVIAHSFGGVVLSKLFEKESVSDLISAGIWLSPYPHTNDYNYIARFLFSKKIFDFVVYFITGKIKNKYELDKYLLYDDKIDIELVKNYSIRAEDDSKLVIDFTDLALNMPLKENIVNNTIPRLIIGSCDDVLIDNISISNTAKLLDAKNPVMVKGPGHNMMLGTYYTLVPNKIINFLDKHFGDIFN